MLNLAKGWLKWLKPDLIHLLGFFIKAVWQMKSMESVLLLNHHQHPTVNCPATWITWAFIWSKGIFLRLGCKLAEIGTFRYACVQCLAQSSIWSHQSSTPEVFQSIWNWQQNLTLPVCIQLALSICFGMCLSAV